MTISICADAVSRGLARFARLAASALLALVFAFPIAAPAQEARWGLQANASSSDISAALDILAGLPTLRPTDLDVVLTEVGFGAASRPAGWQALSEREKLRQAYRWARAVSDENGMAFIIAATKRFEARYESIAFDPLLGALVSGAGQPPKVQFARPTATHLAQPLPRELDEVIDRLSRYVDVPGPLGRGTVARRHFGLDGDHLLDTLQAREPKEFLNQAARRATPPPPIYERINGLIREVIRASDAAANDLVLTAVAEQLVRRFGEPPGRQMHAAASAFTIDPNERLRPDPPESAGGGGGGGGGGGTPERQQRAQETHRKFESQHYPNARSRGFPAASGRAGGRGGVLAGAPVNGVALGRPVSLTIELPRGATCAAIGRPAVFGDVLVRTSNGEYRYPHVRCDVLLAARQLVFDNLGGVSWSPGEALGLASIDLDEGTSAFPLFLPEGSGLVNVSSRRRMVLHPALLDLPVGRSAAVLDLWPGAPVALLRATGEDRSVARWLKSLKEVATWKWLDSPSRLSVVNGEITVKADRRRTLLAFRAFSESDLMQETMSCDAQMGQDDRCARLQTEGGVGRLLTGFDAAAPVLVANVQEFADIESLMRTLSLFRWARLGGVSNVVGNVPLPPSDQRAQTPDTVASSLGGDWIASLSAQANWLKDCQTFVTRFERAREAAKAGKSGYERSAWIETVVLEELQELGVLRPSAKGKLAPQCTRR